jgi:hypothetical protein
MKCSSCGSAKQHGDGLSSISQQICPLCENSKLSQCGIEDKTNFPINHKSVFCDRCVANQNLVLEILQAVEADEESYRKSLEERYPPVCSLCWPKVQCKIEEMNQKYSNSLHSFQSHHGHSKTSIVEERSIYLRQSFESLLFIYTAKLISLFLIVICVWEMFNRLEIHWRLISVIGTSIQPFTTIYHTKMVSNRLLKPRPISSSEWLSALLSSVTISFSSYLGSYWIALKLLIILRVTFSFNLQNLKQTFAPQQTTFKVSSNVARYESIGALGSDRPLPITKLPISQGFKFLELDDIQPTDVHATVDGIPKSFKTETFDNSFGGVRLDSDPRTVHLNMFTAQAFGEARVSVRSEANPKFELAPQRFFGRQEETGLEEIFHSSFI